MSRRLEVPLEWWTFTVILPDSTHRQFYTAATYKSISGIGKDVANHLHGKLLANAAKRIYRPVSQLPPDATLIFTDYYQVYPPDYFSWSDAAKRNYAPVAKARRAAIIAQVKA